jgi:putative transposase
MTDDSMALADLLQKAGDGDFLRSVAETVLQMLMEADVESQIGAGRHERSAERLTQRNGYRDRSLDTRLGTLNLRIPKLRQGSYFPPFLEARKTSEKALVAVIQEAWIGGVSTRRVDELVQAMGLSGISKSTVSKLCRDIDERVGAFSRDYPEFRARRGYPETEGDPTWPDAEMPLSRMRSSTSCWLALTPRRRSIRTACLIS